jgi:hypothetical protein
LIEKAFFNQFSDLAKFIPPKELVYKLTEN